MTTQLNGKAGAAVSMSQIAATAAAKAALSERAKRADGGVDWDHVDVEIERHGTKITLPLDPTAMPIDDAVQALIRLKASEEEVMSVSEVIETSPLDGAVAFMRALKQQYGWASPIPTPGFFGPQPPAMLTVDVGPNASDKIQVPWGRFVVPGIENPIDMGIARTEFGPAMRISGEVRKKEAHILKELAELTREIVRTNSIYRGQAIRLRTDESTGDLEPRIPPTFIQTSKVKPEELILSDSVRALVETNIFTLVRRTEACVRNKIPLKRGVLLEGKYGTGKTMTALVTAKHAVDNGWTFIMLDRCQSLRQAIEFGKRYQPCVIFAEDIDRATGDRNEKTNDLANVIDGMLSKDSQILVVMTTNHVDKIDPVMLRPGRLDAVISVLPPDAGAVQGLVRLYARGLLPADAKLERIGAQLAGNIPAFIREVVERSKLAMIARDAEELAEDDLIVAATGMQHHMALLAGPKTDISDDPRMRIGHDIARLVAAIVMGGSEHTLEGTARVVTDRAEGVNHNVSRATEALSMGVAKVKDDTGKIRSAVAR